MRPLDVIVCGSVAVNPNGVRIGKGAGYSDIEMALLAQAGLVTDTTLVVTTVHSLQVTDEPIPESEHDVSVNLIVTPRRGHPVPARAPPLRDPLGVPGRGQGQRDPHPSGHARRWREDVTVAVSSQ